MMDFKTNFEVFLSESREVSYQEALNSLSLDDGSMDEAFFFIGEEPKRLSTLEYIIGEMLFIPEEEKNGFNLCTVDGNYVTLMNAIHHTWNIVKDGDKIINVDCTFGISESKEGNFVYEPNENFSKVHLLWNSKENKYVPQNLLK